jgi:MEMO1 family protein
MEKLSYQNTNVREPAFAGKFYPESGKELSRQLDELFAGAMVPAENYFPRAIIAPHAGYIFSGQVAASAYNQISTIPAYRKVFILASSHQYFFKGAAMCKAGIFITPLGKVAVDTELSEKLIESNKLFRYHEDAHRYEHSLEVQLPFLQHILGDNFLLVPVIIGTNNPSDCQSIAATLKPWFTKDNLFVISTDFSHYPAYDDAVINDLHTADAICTNDPDTLLRQIDTQERIDNLATSLCGWTSVLTLLYLTQNKKLEFKKIHYLNSGDSKAYGDKERVVGYWAISICSKEEKISVSKKTQKELLKKAQNAIVQFLESGQEEFPKTIELSGVLSQSSGMFVTIYVNGELRGCIGSLNADDTPGNLVQHLAVSAACDSRFTSLKKDELHKMELEISVLSPLKRIVSIDEIELGKHGIFMKTDCCSGTFLPQVIDKTGWTLDEFLGHCARDKAGLNWNGWKEAELFTFEACVFRDNPGH